MMSIVYTTSSEAETIAVGRELTSSFSPPQLLLLQGDLGAGKTTLVKGLAEGFGVARRDDVTSPTFTLVHEYRGPETNLYHIDVYRIETLRELDTLGIDDLRNARSIIVVEWGAKFDRLLKDSDAVIEIVRMGENERRILIRDPSRLTT